MKRILSIYLVILTSFFGIFSFLGVKSDYVLERKVWNIHKRQMDIAKDPNVIPDAAFDQVIAQYKKLIIQYPESYLVKSIYVRLGEVYVLRKDYEKARGVFAKIIELYSEDRLIVAEAMMYTGKTFEVQENWQEANKIYQEIIRDYTLTDVGLSMPIYIANYFRGKNDFNATMAAYELAIVHYRKIADELQKKKQGVDALRFLSDCYVQQNRWKEAVAVLGRILIEHVGEDYLSIKHIDATIKTINVISAYQLKDYDMAISLYKDIIESQPKHPLRNHLKKVIEAFEQLKKKDIQVSK